MRIVVQRVSRGEVRVNGQIIGKISKGLMILLGIQSSDDQATIDYMVDKIIHLRIFEDEQGKMNVSLKDIGGELLVVPNFTLYGDGRKGRRPSYSSAASPAEAEKIFDMFLETVKSTNIPVQQGEFQAEMEVEIINDGPITLLLDSDKLF